MTQKKKRFGQEGLAEKTLRGVIFLYLFFFSVLAVFLIVKYGHEFITSG